MARPVHPVAIIERASPRERGMLVAFPWQHDFRPDGDNWMFNGVEYLEELGAFGPVARPTQEDMLFTGDGGPWEIGHGAYWSTVRPSGWPAAWWLKWGDGQVYAAAEFKAGTGTIEHSQGMGMNWQMSLLRWAPPYGQGVIPQVCVRMPAVKFMGVNVELDGEQVYVEDWWPAWFGLYLPLCDQQNFPYPLLHGIGVMDDDFPEDNYIVPNTMGQILDAYQSAGLASWQEILQRGETWQVVRFEAMGDGSHVRVGLSGSDQYWTLKLDGLRVVPSTPERRLSINVLGHMAAIHFGELEFFGGKAEARRGVSLPADCNSSGAQYDVVTDADQHEWGVVAANVAKPLEGAGGLQRPQVIWDRRTPTTDPPGNSDPHYRLLVYNVHAQTDARFGYKQPGATSTTEASGKLEYLEWTEDISGKGLRGTARFKATAGELFADWTINSTLRIEAGYQQGSPARGLRLEVYLMSPVWRRDVDQRDGLAIYEVQFGDYVEARMRPHKELMDWAQAGGQPLGDWFRALWERLGVPAAYVDVCAEAEGITICSGDRAGTMNFDCPDGTSPEDHLDEVITAEGFRWGVSRLNRPYLALSYEYIEGTSIISHTVTEAPGDMRDLVPAAEHSIDVSNFTNRWKIGVGHKMGPMGMMFMVERVHYKGDDADTRAADIGDTWERYVEVESEMDEALLFRTLNEKTRAQHDPVRWPMVGRPELVPGQYARFEIDWLWLAWGAAVQMTQLSHTMDAVAGTAGTTAEGVVVWEMA